MLFFAVGITLPHNYNPPERRSLMKFTNEQFTVKFGAVYETKRGPLASFVLSQPCPVNPTRTVEFHLKINGGQAANALAHMPVGAVVQIAEGMVTNDSYNRNAKDKAAPADWRDQQGLLMLGALTIISVPAAPVAPSEDEAAPEVAPANLPWS
jgi:hypothetical protein